MPEPEPMAYDRARLLLGEKRHSVLALEEVERYGRDSFGDADYVCLYGLRPAEWYSRGVRVLGRTAVECTRDALARSLAHDVAAAAALAPDTRAPLVVDPFAGSGNTLLWLARAVGAARAVGFETDPGVVRLTRANVAALDLPIEIRDVDYAAGLAHLHAEPGQPVIAFVAPPWGEALDPIAGLDLAGTQPPVTHVLRALDAAFPAQPLLCAIQVYERVEEGSLEAVATCLDWMRTRVYSIDAPGRNHALLLGGRRFPR